LKGKLLLQSECMLWITYPAYLSSGCHYPANCTGFTWSSGLVWAWNGPTDVSMGPTKPRSGENTTLNIAHPHLHLNPILPFEPALVHPFVNISIPHLLWHLLVRAFVLSKKHASEPVPYSSSSRKSQDGLRISWSASPRCRAAGMTA